MNRIYSLVWSAANGCLTVVSEAAKAKKCSASGAGGGVPGVLLASSPFQIKALAAAVVFGLTGAAANAQSTATTWGTSTTSGSTVYLTGTLGTANVAGSTGNYGNAGGVFSSNWGSILPVSYQPITGAGSISLGYTSGLATTQTFSFTQAVVNPVLMFNWLDSASYNFSGLTLGASPITYAGGSASVSLTGSSLTLGSTSNSGSEGFSVQLLGSYTSGSFTITSLIPGAQTAGFGIAVLTSQVPTGTNLPDIVSPNNQTSSNTSGFNIFSNVGSSFTNRFNGGTLKVDGNNVTTSAAFTITANKGYIDQNGNASTFAGVISNDGNDTGRLVIQNTAGSAGTRAGRVILSGVNTYSGGTEVQAGATLQIANASALGSGRLDLVGSANESATLAVTDTTTIANNITVSGDPTFDIASGTTTTVSGVIADGTTVINNVTTVIPGDVVKTGTGTLALTAANTYTGPTTISAGTLALSGSGAIANSSSVTNNATLDVTGVSGNVALKNYTQASSATLKMNVSADPASNQKVNVTGTTSLGGTLNLAASAGVYRPAKYTLMTSTGALSGTFSALSTNLASVTNYNYSLGYDANNVYLYLRSNAADTMASINALGADLNKVYNAQYGIAQMGLSYDCKLFDANNLCLSTGARVTHSRADGSTYDGVALIAAYRAQPDLRLGAWIDQNESRKIAMNVTAGNSTPMVGAFAVWNENPATAEGLEVKLSAAYGQKDLSLTRPVVGTSERGQGSSKLSTMVAEATVGYGIALDSRTSISPFAGLRYARLSNMGYSEGSDIFSPLTFAKTSQSASSVIAGVNLYDKPEGPIGLDLNAGVERYVSTSAAQISATGLDGLSTVQMTPILSKNRPFASASLRYEIDKNQHLLFGLSHSKQFTNSDWVTSATVRYVIGL